MAIGLGSITSQIGIRGAGFLGKFVTYLIWGLVIGIVLVVVATIIRDKVKYKYWAFILKRRQNDPATGLPTSNSISGKAGYFKKRKTGKTVYRIKYGPMPWQQMETAILPDPKYMIGNLAIFTQPQKDMLIQSKLSIDWEGGEDNTIEPIGDETKYGIQLELNEIDRILKIEKFNPVTVGVFILGIILTAGIVVFYFLTKAG